MPKMESKVKIFKSYINNPLDVEQLRRQVEDYLNTHNVNSNPTIIQSITEDLLVITVCCTKVN